MNRFLPLLFLFFFGISSAQQINDVDFVSADVKLRINDVLQEIEGEVIYNYLLLKDVDSIYIDAKNFTNIEVSNELGSIESNYNGQQISIKTMEKFSGKDQSLKIKWKVSPSKAMYFINWENEGRKQIWTQGQGKYTSNWMPSFDDMQEKVEFDITVSFNSNYEVIANGELVEESLNDSVKTWRYNMNKPMSSYLVAIAIGNYSKHSEVSNSGIPLEYYYYPEDSSKIETTYRYAKQMFDFMEHEIGVPYPWEIYKQVPVKDFLYSGMENTSLTIFSDVFVVDSIAFNDRNYVNVNAHELAHQWFGDLVTETSGTHHWLQEGFATYYALLAERDLFGDDYYYWRLYEYAQQLLDQEKAGESTSMLDPKSSSLTFYQKGCWALHVLREQVGEEVFKTAVKAYLKKYQYKNVETKDFIFEVEQAGGQDLSEFVKVWLEEIALPQDVMVKSLDQSYFIQEYQMVDCEIYTSKCRDYLSSGISDKAKMKVVAQIPEHIAKDDFHNGWEVRQAIAQNLTKISPGLKKSYESLLNDRSYVTMESALYNLWVNFPEDRSRYLQKTKDVIGFSDYNIRLLWLALHLNTIEYQPDKKQEVFDELKRYTNPRYGYELRMNAFKYLQLLNGFDTFTIQNLMDASHHSNWRFQQYAKGLLETLNKNKEYRLIIEKIKTDSQ